MPTDAFAAQPGQTLFVLAFEATVDPGRCEHGGCQLRDPHCETRTLTLLTSMFAIEEEMPWKA